MSGEQRVLDGSLAWAIASWGDAADAGTEEVTLTRAQITSLANHLTGQGFTNAKPDDPFESLRKLRPTVERVFGGIDELLGGKPRDTASTAT